MSLSDVIRGNNNHCRFCDNCDCIGNCSKIGRNVNWEMLENKEVDDPKCPRRRKENSK